MSEADALQFSPMLITDVFDSVKASTAWYDKSKLISGGDELFPFVSRTKADNGVDGFCSRQFKAPEPGNAITIGLDTQTVGYQPVPFYTSQNIQVLRHPLLCETNGLVLATIIRGQMSKFSWGGNGATLGRLKKTPIMVPVQTDESDRVGVDWDGLTRFGAELLDRVVALTRDALQASGSDQFVLPSLRFEPVLITDVFESMKASTAWYDKVSLKSGPGRNLYLSQTQAGNSVAGVVPDQGKLPEPGNCITVTLKTQSTFYQPRPFYTAQNFLLFRHQQLDEGSGLFLVTVLRRALEKFSWGYGVSMARLRKTRIMVPVAINERGETVVDWAGMSAYGRALRARTERELAPVIGESATVEPEERRVEETSVSLSL